MVDESLVLTFMDGKLPVQRRLDALRDYEAQAQGGRRPGQAVTLGEEDSHALVELLRSEVDPVEVRMAAGSVLAGLDMRRALEVAVELLHRSRPSPMIAS